MGPHQPTILIVHGAWHTPEFFGSFVLHLEGKGYDAICPRLPSCNPSSILPDDKRDMYTDADAVEDAARGLVERNHQYVLIFAHSYAGAVGSQGIPEELALRARQAAGRPGGVIGFLAVAAFTIPLNSTLEDLGGGKKAPFVELQSEGATKPNNPGELFYHDLDEHSKKHWATKLVSQPDATHKTTLTRAAYKFLPAGYIICQQDKAFLMAAQEKMVESMRDAGVFVKEYRLKASHSPYLSQPQKVIEIIEDFIVSISGTMAADKFFEQDGS